MLINEVKELVEQLAEKSAIGGYLPPDEFSNYASMAQLNAINQMSDMIDFNQQIITLASDVIKSKNITVTNGYFDRPSDYYKFVSCSTSYFDGSWQGNSAELIGVSERQDRMNSDIVQPTFDFPILTDYESVFRIDPYNIPRVELFYFFLPEEPVWAEDRDTVPPVFNPSTSTDFVLSSKFKWFLVAEIAKMFSIEVKDVNLQQATIQNLLTTS